MKTLIEVKHLSKNYKIHHQKVKYNSLRDELTNVITRPFASPQEKSEIFYALKDINFAIKQGESVGIIGPNGAGKSTLLKILSRITPPSKGEILLKGKLASLLEVGTGFHPELTGRENIFLSGAVLGMRHNEIKRKLDEIVDFSGVEKFLDEPVKHYSSGMYTRLAFSVAAHLEPDILIVDEVLAVGDAAFQKKCLGKMSEASEEGKTVIFVSHNMQAISQLCAKSIYINNGKIVATGNTQKIISRYLSSSDNTLGSADFTSIQRTKESDSAILFNSISIKNSKQKITNMIQFTEPFEITITLTVTENVEDFFVGVSINNSSLRPIYTSQINNKEIRITSTAKKAELTLKIDPNIFGSGIYTIGLGMKGNKVLDFIPAAINFTIATDPKHTLQEVYDSLAVYPRKWKVKIT